MRVNQLVPTIVGEGYYAGTPCLLVRLSGCNLHCAWCDTSCARRGGSDIPFATLVERGINAIQNCILLTGGEPLLQRSTPKLVNRWVEGGKFVHIETNGTLPIDKIILKGTAISMDIKTPSSGENGKHHKDNLRKLRSIDFVKIVIADRKDFDWAKGFVKSNRTKSSVFFQPVWGRLSAKKLTHWIMDEIPQVRLSVQLHKILKLP